MLFPKRPGIQLFITFAVKHFPDWFAATMAAPPLQQRKKQTVCFNCASVNSLFYQKLKITISHS